MSAWASGVSSSELDSLCSFLALDFDLDLVALAGLGFSSGDAAVGLWKVACDGVVAGPVVMSEKSNAPRSSEKLTAVGGVNTIEVEGRRAADVANSAEKSSKGLLAATGDATDWYAVACT